MSGGLGDGTVVCFWYMFWCQVIESLVDSGVITKKTLLSFQTLPNDPKRALDLPKSYEVVAGSVGRWRRGGAVEQAT